MASGVVQGLKRGSRPGVPDPSEVLGGEATDVVALPITENMRARGEDGVRLIPEKLGLSL